MRRTYLKIILSFSILGCHSLHQSDLAKQCETLERLRDTKAQIHWATAHRGLRSAGPDNSRASIRGAIKAKLPLIEIDIRKNIDGDLFLFHDRKLRPGNSEVQKDFYEIGIQTLKTAEILKIKLPKSDEKVLFFKEALEILKGSNTAAQLDLKGESRELIIAVANQVIAQSAECHVVFQLQSIEGVRFLRENYPTLALLFRAEEGETALKSLPYKPEIVHLDFEDLTPELSKSIHDAGSRVLAKSLDEIGDNEKTWERLKRAGVEIVMTDFPLEYLKWESGGK